MILTVLEAKVEPGRESELRAAYESAGTKLPPGLVRSELLRDDRDTTRWRIQTLWENRAALDAMRSAGTPPGVLMFRAAGAEPVLAVFGVMSTLRRAVDA